MGLPLSELHGGLCGILCAAGATAAESWLTGQVQDHYQKSTNEPADELKALWIDSWGQLAGSDMQFSPLIPEDDEQLAERVEALAGWCGGFLSGLGLGGFALEGGGVGEVDEIVNDFAEISRAAVGAEKSEDEAQAGFHVAELVEYVRVGVQIVFEELHSVRARAPRAGNGR